VVIDAIPLLFVTADPAEDASTVKLTVAPTTAAPPVVRVSVAESVTGPEEPNWTVAGLGADRASVVATFALVTTKDPAPVAKSAADVSAFTVKGVVPPGVAPVVEIVNVAVLLVSAAANETGFGTKDAVAPVGSTVVTESAAVKAPAEPGPVPRVTVMVYMALPPAVTGLGACVLTVTLPTFGASVKVV
jgi:hypothetical protein